MAVEPSAACSRRSVTLLVLPTVASLRLRLGTNAPAGQLELWLDGQSGLSFILQSSTNLMAWTAVSTNAFSSNSFRCLLSTTSNGRMFYRGLVNSHFGDNLSSFWKEQLLVFCHI